MANDQHLSGSCSCGRNQYVVMVPDRSSELEIFFDNSIASRRTHAAPLAAFLRVPISLYHSATYAFYDDETHNSIRRTYHSSIDGQNSDGSSRRQFCGYCGTQLSSWTEEREGQGDYISVTLGSMRDADVERLRYMGLLPSDEDVQDDLERSLLGIATRGRDSAASTAHTGQLAATASSSSKPTPTLSRRSDVTPRGAPWFESMVENSHLGRIRKQAGGHTSNDGATTVEWEIVEVDGGATIATSTTETLQSPAKRKHTDGDDMDEQ